MKIKSFTVFGSFKKDKPRAILFVLFLYKITSCIKIEKKMNSFAEKGISRVKEINMYVQIGYLQRKVHWLP